MADRLTAMLVFTKAVETGSFAGAADKLGMSAQMAGRYVAQLERRLGARLLNRSTHSQSLTEAGQVFLAGCRRVFAELEAAEERVTDHAEAPRGTLRITAPVGIGSALVIPRLKQFLDAHPELRIEMTLSDRSVDLIDEGYDAALRVGDMPDSTLLVRMLGTFPIVTCAAPSYLEQYGTPERPNDLSEHHLVDYAFNGRTIPGLWRFKDGDDVVDLAPVSRLVINDDRALIDAALSGSGIIRIGGPKIAQYLETGQLIRLLADYDVVSWPLRLVFSSQKQVAPKLRVFIDWLTEALSELR